MTAGIILAAGTGSRFAGDTPKLLSLLRGRPLLQHVVDALSAASLSPLVVVVGHEADRIIAACDLGTAVIVHNEAYRSGQASSLRCGLAAIPSDATAALVAMGDQPCITPAVVDRLLTAYREGGRPIVVPMYAGERGTPVLLGRAAFERALQLDGDVGARAIMRDEPGWILEVNADGLADPRDIDTTADLRRLEAEAS